jgi:FkbM family methyltransferase
MITLKKITAHNLFVKWPKIIIRRGKEKIKNSKFRMLLFYDKPIILVDIYGIKFILYPWDKTPLEKLISRRIYREEVMAMKKFILEGDIIFDIGANVGFLSCLLARLVGQTGKVYAFEPVKETFYQLKENLTINRLENVSTHRLAIFNEKQTIMMNLFEQKYSGWNSIGKPKFKELTPTAQEEVATETLDNFCEDNKIDKINFLKIDVEGFEKYVLLGAGELLKNKRIEYLSFEISEIPLKGSGVKPREVFDILKSYNYQSYEFDLKQNKFIGPIDDSHEFLKNYYASYHDLTSL